MNVVGVYHHFKGKDYQVLGEALDLKTKERLILYKQLYGLSVRYWLRPEEMFMGENSEGQKRFERINAKSDFDNVKTAIHTETNVKYNVLPATIQSGGVYLVYKQKYSDKDEILGFVRPEEYKKITKSE